MIPIKRDYSFGCLLFLPMKIGMNLNAWFKIFSGWDVLEK
jgi:hypothetical protein